MCLNGPVLRLLWKLGVHCDAKAGIGDAGCVGRVVVVDVEEDMRCCWRVHQ